MAGNSLGEGSRFVWGNRGGEGGGVIEAAVCWRDGFNRAGINVK